jgi:molybdate transport system substrate-binding protein
MTDNRTCFWNESPGAARLWRTFCCGLLLGGLLISAAAAGAQNIPQLTVAVAANLELAMKDLRQDFERQTNTQLNVVYGASGSLLAQIENGAPFDVFLSADMAYPRKLIAEHLADGSTLYRYAIGRLVLWAPAATGLDLPKLGMESLLSPRVTKIAMANPRHAPYGHAALAALRYFKLYGKVSSKLVMGESVSQAAQFVESGNAQVGFLPLSLVFAPETKTKGVYFEVPQEAYPVIEQGAVVLAKTTNRQLADQFLAFLKQPGTVLLLKKYGFLEPPTLGQ